MEFEKLIFGNHIVVLDGIIFYFIIKQNTFQHIS